MSYVAPIRLGILPRIPPINGRDIEFRVNAPNMEYRYAATHDLPAGDWQVFVPLATITGPTGDTGANIELRTNGGYVQWRVVGSPTWTDLIALSAITGPAGYPGFNGDPLEITTTTSMTNASHKGKTIRVTAHSVTLTFPVATDLDSDFFCVLINPMTDAAVRVAATGNPFEAFWLWPGQTAFVYRTFGPSSAEKLMVDRPRRYLVPANGDTIYFSQTSGNDTNDGLASTRPRATVQSCLDTVAKEFDHQGIATVIKGATTGDILDEDFVHTMPLVGIHVAFIEGFDTSDPTKTIFRLPGAGGAMAQVRDFCAIIIRACQFSSLGSGSIAITASQLGIADVWDVVTGTLTGGIFFQCTRGSSVGYSNGGLLNRIAGPIAVVWSVSDGGGLICTSCTVTVDVVNFTTWAVVQSCARASLNDVTFVDNSASGAKYAVSLNGVIVSGGETLPGPSAGSTATGGQYS